MKRVLISIDDEAAKELAKSKNQSETVRHALKVYQSGISTETFAGIAASYKLTEKRLKEIDSKLDYIASKL